MKLTIHILLFFLTFFFIEDILAQSSEIKDVVNRYVKITSIEGISAVRVTSAVNFAPGDTVMIVQMKGAIYSPDDPNIIDYPGNMGKYELTVVGSVSGNDITFNSPLKNSYDISESVQLVRIPSYTNAVVTDKLTCDAWDGEKGGILAVIASNSISLKADIDISGKGFRGGAPVYYTTGTCFAKINVRNKYNILKYSADSTSGIKGEGAITNQFKYTLGKGPSGNGGGAGVGAFTGGGGGGNSGIGGNGSKESCALDNDLNWGGNGGRIDAQYFSNNLLQRRVFLGGGGGSGIQKSVSSGTAGGNGGGILILLTPYLITNGYSIKANGDDVTNLVYDGSSSGGGGGGGMVLLAIDSVKNSLIVSASGGNGGGTALESPCEGQGGGGGGGFVWFSGKELNFTQLNISGGEAGIGSCDVSSTDGNPGDSLNRLSLPLTGFLNNTIKADTKTCYGNRLILKGSRPQGGNGTYVYQWQYRNYGSKLWLPAPGKGDSIDYKTEYLTDTTQFRRIVSSDGMNDISRTVTINVFPEIFNNIIDPDTVLCYGSASVKIRESEAQGGTGNFTYEWSKRNFTGSWETVSGISNTANFLITSDNSRYYRRKATSDYCSTYDSVKIEVLPLINNNMVLSPQTICLGAAPESFLGKTPEGGAGIYKYEWQKSNDSLNWSSTTTGTKDFSDLTVLTHDTYYRRIVMSGLNDCCRDTSNNIKVTVLPKIFGNTISSSQVICEGDSPDLFKGSNPSGGDSNSGYRYQWESSTNSVTWDFVEYSNLIKDYQAKRQDATQSFRRIVFSGLNDCCKSISNEIKVTVQPKIINNIITGDTSICYGAIPSLIKGRTDLKGGDEVSYSSKWLEKKTKSSWQNIEGVSQFTYQPSSLTDITLYQRIISSGNCTDSSNVVKINVLETIHGNEITGTSVVCEGFPAEPIGSAELSGGEPGNYRITWERSLDNDSWEVIKDESSIPLYPGILSANTYFKRLVNSGPFDCCQSASNIFKISVDKKPDIPEGGVDKFLIYQDTVTLLATIPMVGKGVWSTSSEASIHDPDSYKTGVSGLKFGRYLFYWTVTNGVCPSVEDSVIIEVSDLQKFTGFSPNGDGINDYFIIEGLKNASGKDLTVLNRWGVEVFHSSDYQNDWDGKSSNGESLPSDTYFYVLKIKDIFSKDKQRIYKGYITIKR